jgi:uroporphyrinogen-III synthase
MHFSRRSARAFLVAAREAGVEISALALPQCCISDAVGMVLRDAGAMHVTVARAPNEEALVDALDRALKPPPQ